MISVFSTKPINDTNDVWDGTFTDSELPTGVFVWMARGKDINGIVVTAKGTFVLIR